MRLVKNGVFDFAFGLLGYVAKCSPGGPVIPGSRRNLFKDQSFDERDNAGTKAFKSHASGALHAKEEVGWGGRAHREWCRVGERGNGERSRLWVSA